MIHVNIRVFLLLAFVVICIGPRTTNGQDKDSQFAPCAEPRQFYKSLKKLPKNAQKPKMLKRSEPEYTREARIKRVEGTVVLEATFGCDGTVTDIEVLAGLPEGLNDVCIAVTKQIKFRPGLVDGKSVSVRLRVEYMFHLI